jgi:endonuclease III
MSANPFTPFTSDAEIAAIGRGVLELSLPKPRWTHAAHFAVALWLMSCRRDLDAARAMPGFIRAYNEATGVANTDTDGYHETITQASLRAARGFLLQNPERRLFETCNALMASPLGKSDWLLGYWSRALLFSVEARRNWVEPDLKPLPWAPGS